MSFKKTMVGAFVGISLIAGPIAAAVPANAVISAPTDISNIVKDDNFQEIQEVFNAINVFRASKGLPAVTYNVYAANVAQDWSDYMGAEADFAHNPNFSTDPRISGNQYSGEIIAARWDRSGQALVNQWINSPGHNAIMSDPNFTTIGIGITYTNETGKTFEETGRLATYGNVDFYRFVPNKGKTFADPLDAKNNINPLPIAVEPTPVVPSAPIPTPTPTPTPTPEPTLPNPAPIPSKKVITPLTPTFDDWEQSYTIPNQLGIIYSVNGVSKRAGTYNTAQTAVKIIATAVDGYELLGISTWDYKYKPTWTIPRVPNGPAPVRVKDLGLNAKPTASEVQLNTEIVQSPEKPFAKMSKGALAEFLYKSSSSPDWTPPKQSPLQDLTPDTPFYKEITWMEERGITDETVRQLQNANADTMADFLFLEGMIQGMTQ